MPFRFDWKAGDTLSSLTDLIAGSYNLTITDAKWMSKSRRLLLYSLEELKSTSSVTHVKCYGGSDGSLTVLAQGGTPPYNYDFSSGNGTNLPAGRYSIMIPDLNNCTNLDTQS
ncbi:MAG: SprB repeat-containing protein [Saprospiraceae bacterium]|nr:SprB repeat-containing protein [Saprospiraceae bacterium]